MTDEKILRTITAAGEVFLRYGYLRTTMSDIARAAGMSRPALYLLFAGKEQIFEAATMFLAKQRLEEIRSAADLRQGLNDKLVTACEMLLISVYELQQSAPDARDMDDLAFPVVREIYAMFVDFFAGLITQEKINHAASAQKIADVLLYGARGMRNVATSEDEYRQMIRLHTALICDGLTTG